MRGVRVGAQIIWEYTGHVDVHDAVGLNVEERKEMHSGILTPAHLLGDVRIK